MLGEELRGVTCRQRFVSFASRFIACEKRLEVGVLLIKQHICVYILEVRERRANWYFIFVNRSHGSSFVAKVLCIRKWLRKNGANS